MSRIDERTIDGWRGKDGRIPRDLASRRLAAWRANRGRVVRFAVGVLGALLALKLLWG